MKLITTPEQFKLTRSRELLEFQCEYCTQTFQRSKHAYFAALNPNHTTKLEFCSTKCRKEATTFLVKFLCSSCNVEVEKRKSDYNKSKNHFCSRSCAYKFNVQNRIFPARELKKCLNCDNACNYKTAKCCSGKCHQEILYKEWIKRWLSGQEDGVTGKGLGTSARIKRWLIEQFGNACSECSWNKTNPVTGKVPIQLDHKDGNAENNSPNNVRLLCPNCHSLTPTFGGLNKGNGRKNRYNKIALVV